MVTSYARAGEHESLRPAVEHLWGAGALIDVLCASGWPDVSPPEARAAVAAYRDVAGNIRIALDACASGRELIAIGYSDDVRTAADVDSTAAAPVLRDSAFRPA